MLLSTENLINSNLNSETKMENKIPINCKGETKDCPSQFQSAHQLTIEIPEVPEMVLMNSPYNPAFQYHQPVYQNEQTGHTSNQFLLQPTILSRDSISTKRPQLYVGERIEQTSDGESDKYSEEDTEPEHVDTMQSPNKLDYSYNSSSPVRSPSSRLTSSPEPQDDPQSSKKDHKKKNRTNYTPKQVQLLERAFVENAYPDSARMESLSNDLNIAQARIKIWFQNKRARFRKRVQGRPGSMPVPRLPSVMPTMASYGFPPHHHPMFHGSHIQQMPNPYYYPGYSFGMPSQQNGFLSSPATQTFTPGANSLTSSPASSTTSSSSSEVSPKAAVDSDMKPKEPKTTHPISHFNQPQIHPYMPYPYPYPYGAYPPYFC